MNQRQCGIHADRPVQPEIQILLRIAGVAHASDRLILDVAVVLGGESEMDAPPAAGSECRFDAADV
jgi:hypothetical protein